MRCAECQNQYAEENSSSCSIGQKKTSPLLLLLYIIIYTITKRKKEKSKIFFLPCLCISDEKAESNNMTKMKENA